jgi:hypothetical protein
MSKSPDETIASLIQLRCPKGHVHNFIIFTRDKNQYDEAILTACPSDDDEDDEADENDEYEN